MPHASLPERLAHFAVQGVQSVRGHVAYRQAGASTARRTVVLLHGIGSASGSWLAQLEAAALHPQDAQVLAWEAPGYGASQAVAPAQPTAFDYALAMWSWLDALGIGQPITLVGHSLGAVMAASAACQQAQRVASLVLLSPAQGYGLATEAVRKQKRDERLHNLATLGPAGMAAKRASAMLSAHASPEQIAYIEQLMAHVQVAGYTQATHLLAQADILTDLAQWTGALSIASGRADTITPMANCQALAHSCHVPWHDLGDVGHACALEGAAAVNALLQLGTHQQDNP